MLKSGSTWVFDSGFSLIVSMQDMSILIGAFISNVLRIDLSLKVCHEVITLLNWRRISK